MKVEAGNEGAAKSPGETTLAEMNAAFASCLSLVCPPIQYPPHCRFNPVRDASDTAEVETRLEEFFLHAKQLELLFLEDTADALAGMNLSVSSANGTEAGDGAAVTEEAASVTGRQQQSELELEILNLEAELAEKNELIEKYSDVVRGWEGKFKRLDHRMSPDRD